jgi:hypothetical protein
MAIRKHRTEAAKKYHAALKRLAKSRDDSDKEVTVPFGV